MRGSRLGGSGGQSKHLDIRSFEEALALVACKRFSVKAREIADPNSQAVMVSVKLLSAVAALRFPSLWHLNITLTRSGCFEPVNCQRRVAECKYRCRSTAVGDRPAIRRDTRADRVKRQTSTSAIWLACTAMSWISCGRPRQCADAPVDLFYDFD